MDVRFGKIQKLEIWPSSSITWVIRQPFHVIARRACAEAIHPTYIAGLLRFARNDGGAPMKQLATIIVAQ